MTPLQLQQRAQRRLAVRQRRMHDPRYKRVMGRFVHDGLLITNREVVEDARRINVDDVLWAAELEPRLLELLPALIVKKPGMFSSTRKLPPDLADVVGSLRRDEVPGNFRGIPGQDVYRWLRRVGRRGKAPSRLKSFRFKSEDQRLLTELAHKFELSETDVIRRALRTLV